MLWSGATSYARLIRVGPKRFFFVGVLVVIDREQKELSWVEFIDSWGLCALFLVSVPLVVLLVLLLLG